MRKLFFIVVFRDNFSERRFPFEKTNEELLEKHLSFVLFSFSDYGTVDIEQEKRIKMRADFLILKGHDDDRVEYPSVLVL